jgi:hypothetical protein
MTTNAEQFMTKLEDMAFKAAYEAADAAGRMKMLSQAGLGSISLVEAEGILADFSGELDESDLKNAAGGGAGVILPPPSTDD